MAATPTPGSATAAEFLDRATASFRRRLGELIAASGLPRAEPEAVGERAGLVAAAGEVWAEEVGPFLDTEGVMAVLDGVTKQAVSQRVRAGRLLGLRTGSGRLVYPLWQFRGGGLLPGLAEVLEAAGFDPDRPAAGWTIAAWLAAEDPELGGAPREALAAGRVEAVMRAARDVRDELGVDERLAAEAAH